ncbi:DUF3489 domain-containing protein [Rhodoferax antarcticus]|uniref:DUF3489 domain-containing protein n=1 Tax=Rhodoferax antarcticus TaxID=81479 RepID=UPI0022241722|nr:DUF3489 domain-containing protein [Rhodoferax antarcticus]MCW2313373.1 hypothetical protein [Rhodoferax antarcticus]
MTTIQLTATQTLVLQHALDHNDGRIDWFPESVKGGARKKVLDGLFNRALITPSGDDWFVAAEGYDALGCARPGAAPVTPIHNIEADVAAAEASWTLAQVVEPETVATTVAEVATEQKPRTREHSKQATVISMLKRPEGATIAQICEATSWQAHTVRGTFAGAFKKKLGLNITSDKTQGGTRTYRVA